MFSRIIKYFIGLFILSAVQFVCKARHLRQYSGNPSYGDKRIRVCVPAVRQRFPKYFPNLSRSGGNRRGGAMANLFADLFAADFRRVRGAMVARIYRELERLYDAAFVSA